MPDVSITKTLEKEGLANPPPFLVSGIQYETLTGSVAYGVATPESDFDVYGFTIPPKDVVFPHLRGEILGFGRQTKRFEQYQQQHLAYQDSDFDLSIYNIVKYFQLCMENNPNMIDTLFTPEYCVSYITKIGKMVREQRKLFLHKGSWYRFKGFAHSQMSKIWNRANRKELIQEHGYDVKFAYHAVRLVFESQMILEEGDIDLQRHKNTLREVRNGNWDLDTVEDFIAKKLNYLDSVYETSTAVPYSPNEAKIKELLLSCLEEYYGKL